MEGQDYKERVLGTLESTYDFRETARAWRKRLRREVVAKELEEKKQKARDDIVAFLIEGQPDQPREPAESKAQAKIDEMKKQDAAIEEARKVLERARAIPPPQNFREKI